jgi:hypothetical protein
VRPRGLVRSKGIIGGQRYTSRDHLRLGKPDVAFVNFEVLRDPPSGDARENGAYAGEVELAVRAARRELDTIQSLKRDAQEHVKPFARRAGEDAYGDIVRERTAWQGEDERGADREETPHFIHRSEG